MAQALTTCYSLPPLRDRVLRMELDAQITSIAYFHRQLGVVATAEAINATSSRYEIALTGGFND